MAKLPQFENERPIVQPQAAVSGASGFEAFAKAFGETAEKAETSFGKIEDEKSNAMLMTSANQAEQAKNQAQIDMIKSPNNAVQIQKNADLTYASIKQNAFVNKEDRTKLDYLVTRSQDAVNLKAAEVNYTQQKKNLGMTYWQEGQKTQLAIQDALSKHDFETAKKLEDTYLENSKAAAQGDVITPEAYGRVLSASVENYGRLDQLQKASQDPNGMTAQQYHKTSMSPFDTNSQPNLNGINHPVDGNTQWMANHLSTDRTFTGQLTALHNDEPVNLGVIFQAPKAEYDKFVMQQDGKQEVLSMVRSGTPFNQIQANIDRLDSKPTGSLTEKESGMVDYWKSLNNRIQTANGFYGIVGSTTLGMQATAEHQSQTDTIMANPSLSNGEKSFALKQNDNQYMGNVLDIARAQHIDQNFIQPVDANRIEVAKASFQKDAPVLPLLQNLEYLNREFRPYLAQAMPKAEQKMAVYFAGTTMGYTDPSFQADLIHANQSQTDPIGADKSKTPSSLIQTAGDETTDKNIWANLVNNNAQIQDIYSYLGKLPGGAEAQSGFRTMSLNYVKDQASRSGDATLANADSYAKTLVSNVGKGFNFYRTSNSFINLNDIPVTREQDASYLTHYALSEAYKRVHEGKTEAEFSRDLELNPLMVVSTPDKRLVVTDRYGRAAVTADGHEAFDMPYTSNMLAAAQKASGETNNYMRNLGLPSDINFFGGQDPENPTPTTLHNLMLQRKVSEDRAGIANNKKALEQAANKKD